MRIDVYKEWLGIPEGPRPPDHYQLLRLVRFEDDAERIRNHYTKLTAHVRRYATGEYMVESQELLNELARAMLCLTDPERKREYDRSLGREIEEELLPTGRKPMGRILVEQGVITDEQLREADEFADRRGLSIRDALVQMKLVTPEVAAQALAEELGRSYIDLAEIVPDDSVLDRVPRNLVKRNSILPLFVDDDTLLVACIDEIPPELEEELRLRFEVPVRAVIATPLAINQGIAKYYAAGMRDAAAAESSAPTKTSAKKAKLARSRSRSKQSLSIDRRQMGLLIICWTTILAVLFDQFVLKPMLETTWPYWATLLVAPAVALWVVLVYWRKR